MLTPKRVTTRPTIIESYYAFNGPFHHGMTGSYYFDPHGRRAPEEFQFFRFALPSWPSSGIYESTKPPSLFYFEGIMLEIFLPAKVIDAMKHCRKPRLEVGLALDFAFEEDALSHDGKHVGIVSVR